MGQRSKNTRADSLLLFLKFVRVVHEAKHNENHVPSQVAGTLLLNIVFACAG
jgi:hypothetical protein